MDSEQEFSIEAEYRKQRAKVVLADFCYNQTESLLDCSIQVKTCDYTFNSTLCIHIADLDIFAINVKKVAETNAGTAILEDYTRESKIVMTALGTASSHVIVEGIIGMRFPHLDFEYFGDLAETVGHIPTGVSFKFGGLITDQSFLQSPLAVLHSLLKLNPANQP